MSQTGSTAVVSPERQRRPRPTRVGIVTSDRCEKTVAVTLEYTVKHAKYGKYLRRRTRLQVHDERNDARVGDRVEIMECRPISKSKRWRLVRVLERAPQEAGGPTT
ncbi:MAG: 30S ribosomal protein S17 [Phycisphaerae bacterium]|jgi:small subunit ribosomal protein S17